MNSKSRDTTVRSKLLVDAYVESLVGIFSLRVPGVGPTICSMAPEMVVESSFSRSHLILDTKRVLERIARSGTALATTFDQITMAFVAAMWDTLTSHAHYAAISTKPDVQFFRHLRNACAHGGRWNLNSLKYQAQWRTKQLSMAYQGEVVFGGLLKHGDVIQIFTDIDKTYFEGTPST